MSTDTPAPVRLEERSAAPDIARGSALLGIAVANSAVQLYGRELGPSRRPLDGSGFDRAADVVGALLIDNRGYPLFAFLLGYGTAQLVARLAQRGVPRPRVTAVLVRRGLGLVALGAAHALLLFSGDILGTYGLLALLLAALAGSSARTLLAVAAACLLPFAALGALDGVAGGSNAGTSFAEAGYVLSAGLRLLEWGLGLVATPLLGIGLLAPMLLGVLAARRRLLDEPARHRRLLAAVAAGGVTVGVAGGVPLALTSTGTWSAPTAVDLGVGALHGLTGLAGALGYAALAGLVAGGTVAGGTVTGGTVPGGTVTGGQGPVRRALTACGRRSLSCYLAQSVLMVPLLAPWGLGLGGRLGTAGAAVLAATVWAATVLWAAGLERAGRRGPAETALRAWVYRAQPTERQGRARSDVT